MREVRLVPRHPALVPAYGTAQTVGQQGFEGACPAVPRSRDGTGGTRSDEAIMGRAGEA